MEKELDLRTLAPQQLEFLRKQTEGEINDLTANFTQLKAVQSKFADAAAALAAVTPADEGKEVLIPLTSSLYVPGKLASTAEVLVDVGTNFFVGKPVKDAQEIMSKKVTLLKGNTDGILKVVQTKRENLARIDEYIEELRSSQQ